jgi:hypothetical protein
VFICYFIAAQPPHGHDDPLMIVFALNDFASYIFLGVLRPSSLTCSSILRLDSNLQ